jgi:hypothetical protein
MNAKECSKQDLRKLTREFPSRRTEELADELGRTTQAVKRKAACLHLRKSAKYLRRLGRVAVIALAAVLLLTVRAGPVKAAEPAPLPAPATPWLIGTVGNEEQLGVYLGYELGSRTWAGIEGRWYERVNTGSEAASASMFVMWEVVPDLVIPVGGLFPQLDTGSVPQSISASLFLGGSLGLLWPEDGDNSFNFRDRDAVAKVFTEVQFGGGGNAVVGLRYEYAFQPDQWEDLAETPQHSAFLTLTTRF